MSAQIFRDSAADRGYRARWYLGRTATYAALILWAFICLFPIYWTVTTSFKMAPDVMQGNMIPWVDYKPAWLGWRSLGLSPETIGTESTVRAEFMKRFANSVITALSASFLACLLGSLAAYGLSRFSFRFGFMRNSDISFFFLSQLMLPVSITAILIRIIFKLKLADIVITITSGGPGGATDTVTSFIFREYRDRSNVGYGTLLAMVYLVVIILAMTILMKVAERFTRPRT